MKERKKILKVRAEIKNLKVANNRKYNWNPRPVLRKKINKIDNLCKTISEQERRYKPSLIIRILKGL